MNLIYIAYRVDCKLRGPILVLHAIEKMATDWAKDELQEMIDANIYVRDVFAASGRKNDPYLFKKWPGGALIARGGSSGTSYAKISADAVLVDDIDRFKKNIGGTKGKNAQVGEGNPLVLISDRVSGRFGDYKLFVNSSPRAESESIIWPAFKRTDQNHFFVECPRCGLWQYWEFDNLVFPHEDYQLTEEPYILCQDPGCGKRIYEADKYQALQKAEYRPLGKSMDPSEKGFRINALYSLLGYPLKKYAMDWLAACKLYDEEGDASEKIRHRNTKQTQPWVKKVGKTIKYDALYRSRINLAPIPVDCAILTAGVDVQESPARIELQVNGHGENKLYFIAHEIFYGDPNIKFGLPGSPWNKVHKFIKGTKYANAHGKEQPIISVAIDLGYAWDKVKHFITNADFQEFQSVYGVFGRSQNTASINFISKPSEDEKGWQYWGLNVNRQKSISYGLFASHIEGAGGLYFSMSPGLTKNWFIQLTVERKDEATGLFKKPYDHARNEALDCHIYAMAALKIRFLKFKGINWGDWIRWNRDEPDPNQGATPKIVGAIN